MFRCLRARQIWTHLGKHPEIEQPGYATVLSDMKWVREQWAEEAKAGRAERKNELRQLIKESFTVARARTRHVTRKVHTPDGTITRTEEVSAPDMRAMQKAIDQLAELDGLYEAKKVDANIEGGITLSDFAAMAGES